MASISKDKNGTKRITYYDSDKKQVCIRLGKVSKKIADTVKIHVENLLSAKAKGREVDDITDDWLTKISDELHQKLAQKGLVSPRRVVGTLGEMIPGIIEEKKRAVDAKPATEDVYGQAEKSLYRHFGTDRMVNEITVDDAKAFGVWLAKKGRLKDSGALKLTTVSKRLQHVSSFFHELEEKGDIPCNPFSGLAKRFAVDEKRNKYIDEETILKIMEYAPDAEWRLIIALWRFAGLRAVSEVLMLKWEDILWDQKAIMVHSPKTERYQGKEFRKIPFFPHIEECLRDAWEQADEGAIYVVEKHAPLYLRGQKERVYVSRQGNIGTVFAKIIHRAGGVAWPKLIHNLRASFETDLLSEKYGKFGLHVIADWLGHSVKVMLEHYGRFQKSDYDQIAEACLQVKQKAEQTKGNRASWNASLHTAAGQINEANETESPFCSDSTQALENTAHNAKKEKMEAPCGNLQNPTKWAIRDSNL